MAEDIAADPGAHTDEPHDHGDLGERSNKIRAAVPGKCLGVGHLRHRRDCAVLHRLSSAKLAAAAIGTQI